MDREELMARLSEKELAGADARLLQDSKILNAFLSFEKAKTIAEIQQAANKEGDQIRFAAMYLTAITHLENEILAIVKRGEAARQKLEGMSDE